MRKLTALGVADSFFTSTERQPLYKVLLFDLYKDSLSNIVLFDFQQTPHDITDFIQTLEINEEIDNAGSLKLSIQQEGSFPNPYMFVGDKAIQVFISDQRLQPRGVGGWFSMFIGPCVGQPGWTRSRGSEGGKITVTCIDRMFYYNKRRLNTPEFRGGIDIGEVALDIATASITGWGMGLAREEVLFGMQNETLKHTVQSIRDVSFTEGFNKLFFVIGKCIGWNGDGKLMARDMDFGKPPARIFPNEDLIHNINWPENNTDIYNAVEIRGLSNQASRINHRRQVLSEIRGSIGYFKKSEKVIIYYSDDRRARADNVKISDQRVDGWMIQTTKVKFEPIDEFSCMIIIEGNNNKWVFVAFIVIYIVFVILAAILNGVPFAGGVLSAALWISAAVWLTVGLTAMQDLGTYFVEISGEPYEFVYKETFGSYEWSHVAPYLRRVKRITNHFVHTNQLAKEIAKRETIRETVKKCPRTLSLLDDPAIEIDDVIEFVDGSRWYISGISRRYARNSSDQPQMNITAWMIRSGTEHQKTGEWSLF